MAGTKKQKLVALDPETKSTQAHEFEAGLSARIIGQERAVHLKRAIERFLVYPLANLLSTRQVRAGDLVVVELEQSTHQLAFFREGAAAVMVGPSVQKAEASLTARDHDRIAA